MDDVVQRKARESFPKQMDAALRLLAAYEGPEGTRVQLAMLKLAGAPKGNRNRKREP